MCLIGIGKIKEKSGFLHTNESYNSNHSDTAFSELFSKQSSIKTSNDEQRKESFNRTIMINPGPDYKIQSQDLCFYISLVKEENYDWKTAKSKLCKNCFLNAEVSISFKKFPL